MTSKSALKTTKAAVPKSGKITSVPRVKSRATTGARNDAEPYGLADLRKIGGELIAEVCIQQKEISFSTGRVPQIRMRPASKHPEIVENVSERLCITYSELVANLVQYRPLVMFDWLLLVTSRRHKVIVDRHPECPCDIINAEMKDWEAQVRTAAHAKTRQLARRAADTSDEILDYLRTAFAEREKRDDEQMRLIERLSSLLDQKALGELTARDRQLLDRLRVKEGAEAAVAERNRYHEGNLSRTLLD